MRTVKSCYEGDSGADVALKRSIQPSDFQVAFEMDDCMAVAIGGRGSRRPNIRRRGSGGLLDAGFSERAMGALCEVVSSKSRSACDVQSNRSIGPQNQPTEPARTDAPRGQPA